MTLMMFGGVKEAVFCWFCVKIQNELSHVALHRLEKPTYGTHKKSGT